MSEQWRPVVGYEGYYEVSDHGRIRSVERTYTRTVPAKVLKRQHNRFGRVVQSLSRNNQKKTVQISVVVAEAFIGPRPEGSEVLHWDDDPDNNHLDNLRYGSRSENMADAVRNGRHANASRTQCRKGHELTPENVCYFPSNPKSRYCKVCLKNRVKMYKQRRRAM